MCSPTQSQARLLLLLALLLLPSPTTWGHTGPQHTDSEETAPAQTHNPTAVTAHAHTPCFPYCIQATLEYGFVSVLTHTIQWGNEGTKFDYVKEGGQSVLFPYWRPSVELEFLRRHSIEFLYQPIYINTDTVLQRDLQTDSLIFNAGTPVHVQYYFPFYRLTYLYHFIASQRGQLSLGGALQIRNATIVFTSQDGSKRFDSRNVGPVPLIVLRGRSMWAWGGWFESQLGGIWAPLKYLNGSGTDVNGWLYEGHVRLGVHAGRRWAFFVGTRALGGGAIGSSKEVRPTGGSYSANVLNTLSATLGVMFRAGKHK